MIKRIKTGSGEFFTQSQLDDDYLIIQEQEPVFEYVRDEESRECNFCYKPLSKSEYLHWLDTENKWYLNFAPLVSVEFLEHMGIDIFNEDNEVVYNIVKKAFKERFEIPFYPDASRWLKYMYRIYVYYCYIQNGELSLTEQQLDVAYNLKVQRYSLKEKAEMESLYKFFGSNQERIDDVFSRISWSKNIATNA